MGKLLSCVNIGYGHALKYDDMMMFTSVESTNGYLDVLVSILDSMSKDMSNLLNIPIENIIHDYTEENELNIMNAAFNSVLRKKGYEIAQTPTRNAINKMIKGQNLKGE